MKEAKILEKLSLRNRWAGCLHPLNAMVRKDADNYKTSEVEFRAEKFQQMIEKSGGKRYDRTNILKSLRQLESKSEGTIQILENCGKGLYKILVHPLSFLDGKKFRNGESLTSQNIGNPMYSEEQKKRHLEQQQQEKDINQMEIFLDKLNLKFSRSALMEMWRNCSKSVDEFKGAVAFMLDCDHKQTKRIANSYGWLRSCVSRGDHLNYLQQMSHKLPTFKDPIELNAFVTCYLYQDEPDDKTKIWAESKVPKIFNSWDDPVPVPSQ